MTTGGIESGDDYVAARLSIDIPDGSVQGIREITQEVERFRTTMEAATRTAADMSQYLDSMEQASRRAAEAQANLTEQMETYLRMGAQTGMGPSVPMGPAIDPFGEYMRGSRMPSPSDVSMQLEEQRRNNPREYLNMQAARGGVTAQDATTISPQSIQELADKIAERENAKREQALKTDANAQDTQKHSIQSSSDIYDSMAQRVGQAGSLAGRVLNEMGPGGSALGMGRMVLQGVNWARKRYSDAPDRAEGSPPADAPSGPPASPPPGTPGTGAEGAGEEGAEDAARSAGGLSGILKSLGPIAGIASAALTAFGVIEKGGSIIQGARNVGSLRGGAAGQGFEAEARAKLLAMNPFISQEQARQIYQAVMSEGYADASGGGADNVIDFMKNNIENLNMSVGQSASLLRETIVGHGSGDKKSVVSSIQQLTGELDQIKTLSRDSVLSTPDFTAGAMALKQKMMAAGVSSEAAGQIGIGEEAEQDNDQVLKGQMAVGAGDLASSASGQALVRTFGGLQTPAGLMPQMTAAYVTSQPGGAQKWQEAADNTLKHFAMQAARGYRGDEVSYLNAVYFFQLYVRSIEPDQSAASNLDACKALFNSMTGISEPNGDDGNPPEGGGSSAGASSNAATAVASGRSAAQAGSAVPSGGDGGSRGSSNINVGGNVNITLSPEAAKLLQVVGPKSVPLTPLQEGANRGQSGSYVNGSSS